MSKIIDIKTKEEIKPKNHDEMIADWNKYADKYLGSNALTIYFSNELKQLAFIAPNHTVMIELVAATYLHLLSCGAIKEIKKPGTFRKTLNMVVTKILNRVIKCLKKD